MMFQHHLPPTKWNPHILEPYIADPRPEPQYILGMKPGVSPLTLCTHQHLILILQIQPYIAAHSHSIFTRLGARMAFLGVDARTEVSERCPLVLQERWLTRFTILSGRGPASKQTTLRPTTVSFPACTEDWTRQRDPIGRLGTWSCCLAFRLLIR